MKRKCIYCARMATKTVPAGDGQYVCHACAQKSQDYMVDLLNRWFPTSPILRFSPLLESSETKKKKRKKKKMKKDLLSLGLLAAVCVFAGTTIRCNIDDGDDDKDKDKSAFVDVHGHDIQDAVSEALPGALVDFQNPDYQCIAIGSIDREHDTDFDVLFVTACHQQH